MNVGTDYLSVGSHDLSIAINGLSAKYLARKRKIMDNITLNQYEWNGLSQDVRNQITDILEQTGLLREGQEIVTTFDAPTFADLAGLQIPGLSHNVCMTLCDVAQAAAHVACALLPDPVSIAACNAVAIAAGNICRRTCKPAPASLPPA